MYLYTVIPIFSSIFISIYLHIYSHFYILIYLPIYLSIYSHSYIFILLFIYIFLSFEQILYISPRSSFWLTYSLPHSLTHWSVRIMLLKTLQRKKNLTLAASHLANTPWRQQPENSEEYWQQQQQVKNKPPFCSDYSNSKLYYLLTSTVPTAKLFW